MSKHKTSKLNKVPDAIASSRNMVVYHMIHSMSGAGTHDDKRGVQGRKARRLNRQEERDARLGNHQGD